MGETIETPHAVSDKYRFLELLGEGANCKTYLAIQLYTSIKVAVKELKFSRLNDLKSLDLFKREAATLSSINIDGIPKFYESIISDTADNTCYIIQEYVEYPSIQTMIKNKKKISESKSLKIIYQVALLLYELQNKYTPPIIHRDIKPSNILCKKSGKDFQVYLIDFGAVANPQRRSGGSTIAGTFGYMAPEQLLGDVCIQSDYYSLGATLLHMLTGIPPYDIDSTGFKLDISSFLDEYAPKTSEATRSLLEILLAPEIDKRPHNARQLINCIDLVKKGKTVSIATLEDEPAVKRSAPSTSSPILRFINRYLIPHFKSSNRADSTENWTKTHAIIQYENKKLVIRQNAIISSIEYNIIAKEYEHCYEYTFEVNQITYVGFYFTNNSSISNCLNNGETIDCIIAYNPSNPRLSKFIRLKKTKKTNHK